MSADRKVGTLRFWRFQFVLRKHYRRGNAAPIDVRLMSA
jgi:hypothetical protein